jgi:RNA polymerase sigma-70 factor (ECF subfamily)
MTSGDRELFARLMEQTQRPVYAFLAGKLKDRGVVADVAQEAFFQAYRRFDSYDRSRPFLPWIMTIAYNCLVDYWRSSAREGADLPDEQVLAAPQEDEENGWKAQEIVTAMTRISTDESALLSMFYGEKCTVATIAARLGITESAAKVRLFRARSALRKEVEALYGNEEGAPEAQDG